MFQSRVIDSTPYRPVISDTVFITVTDEYGKSTVLDIGGFFNTPPSDFANDNELSAKVFVAIGGNEAFDQGRDYTPEEYAAVLRCILDHFHAKHVKVHRSAPDGLVAAATAL